MPATDDEVMEVEDFLVDGKTEMIDVADIGKTADCTSNEGSDSGKLQLEVSEGIAYIGFEKILRIVALADFKVFFIVLLFCVVYYFDLMN